MGYTIDSLVCGRLTACKHANGRDWWLIAHEFLTNRYYKYLITPYGIDGPYTQNIGAIRNVHVGQCLFSPNGNRFAYYEWGNNLDVFDFDRCTGHFTFKAHIIVNDSAFAGGVAFSSNSQVLYVSCGYGVDQFDLSATDLANSKLRIMTWDGTMSPYPASTTFYLAHLAPDGKVYINCPTSCDVLHVINNPDIIGMGCNACAYCVKLPALNAFTIPNHPNYFLGAETGSVCDSLTSLTPTISKGDRVLYIYPNPSVAEDVTFTYNSSSEVGVLAIYNIEGREIVKYNMPQWSSVQHLKMPKMANGIYMARLQQGKTISSVKFIKE